MSGLLLVLVVAFAVSCKSNSGENDKVLKEAANGKTVTLKVGESAKIELAGNITTGYKWNVISIDENVVKIAKNKYEDSASERPIGAGGVRKITLTALKKGKTELVLAYKRSWEKNVKPLKEYKLSLVVE